ncbi:MAG: peptide chain release factor N(5)-glutamine methyltransferase [bacterium]|jgi:release factor glutamine methyltransferase
MVRPAIIHAQIRERLEACSDVEFARFEADRIVEHIFGLPAGEFWAADEVSPLPEFGGTRSRVEGGRTEVESAHAFERELDRIIAGRAEGVPLAYLLGYAWFNGLKIGVSPGVLIPRQETEGLALIGKELLDEAARRRSDFGLAASGESAVQSGVLVATDEEDASELRVLDFGCGSGCIAVYLALEFPDAVVWASDKSAAAIRATRGNLKRYALGLRVIPVQHDGLAGLSGPANLDLLISNPPYIAADDGRLDESVRLHEPQDALIAPGGGLHYFRMIARFAPGLVAPGGRAAVEVGEGQADDVRRIFWAGGADEVEVRRDLAGIDRYVIARYS